MTKTIRVSQDTYDKLCKLGKFGDTMDNIIQRLITKSQTSKSVKKHKKHT